MELLLELYKQASAITRPLCLSGEGCGELALREFHCCEKKYCDMAMKFARDGYGVELQPTGHAIPFMGEDGCTVPVHIRPVCTLHVCSMSWAGVSTIQHDPEKTEEFMSLRGRILALEAEAGRRVNAD